MNFGVGGSSECQWETQVKGSLNNPALPWHVSANTYFTIHKCRVYKLFGHGVWLCSYRILDFRIAMKWSFLLLFHCTVSLEYVLKGFVHTSKISKWKLCFHVT